MENVVIRVIQHNKKWWQFWRQDRTLKPGRDYEIKGTTVEIKNLRREWWRFWRPAILGKEAQIIYEYAANSKVIKGQLWRGPHGQTKRQRKI